MSEFDRIQFEQQQGELMLMQALNIEGRNDVITGLRGKIGRIWSFLADDDRSWVKVGMQWIQQSSEVRPHHIVLMRELIGHLEDEIYSRQNLGIV